MEVEYFAEELPVARTTTFKVIVSSQPLYNLYITTVVPTREILCGSCTTRSGICKFNKLVRESPIVRLQICSEMTPVLSYPIHLLSQLTHRSANEPLRTHIACHCTFSYSQF